MGRHCYQLRLDSIQREKLEERYREASDVRTRTRLGVLRASCEGRHSLGEIAELMGCSRGSVQTWLKAYETGGLDAVVSRKKPGASSSPMQALSVREQLQQKIDEGAFRTAAQAQHWLRETFGIRLALPTIYYWLKKVLRAALRVPRPVHEKKNPQATESFLATLHDALASLPLEPGRPVRIWVQDEARFGLHTLVRRCWARRGLRVVLRHQRKYKWAYMYGALEIETGQAFTMWMPGVDLGITRTFLEQLAASEPDAEHIIIWDGAGFHQKTGTHALPAHIHVMQLPPYSPELNPIEKLWDVLKDALCNHIFPTLDDLYNALVLELKAFNLPQRTLQLLGQSHMLALANASSKI